MLAQFALTARPVSWLVVVLGVGFALRGYHYLSNPPVWHDEAALLRNVLDKSFGEQLGPLFYSEAAPPLFLWIEKAVALRLGDDTFALRLLPFLASCAALVGMFVVGRRVLSGPALLVLLLLFACSDRLLWHACEAKPYALDVLIAVGLLALFAKRGQEEPVPAGLAKQLLLLAAVSPLLVFLSFPACFLLGGAGLALLPAVARARHWRTWGACGVFGLVLCGSFLALLFGPIHAQKNERMLSCWIHLFPPWDRPWLVPFTTAVRLTEVFRYASEPIGNVLSVFAVAGAVELWRAGRRRLLGFLVAPVALAAVAWLVGQYPIGPVRVMVYAAPAALLLIAAGVPPVLRWAQVHARLAVPVAAVFLLVPAVQAVYRVAVPWKRLEGAVPSRFVLGARRPDEPVVGARWEHAYYCRDLGPLYRAFDPQPAEPPTLPPASPVGLPARPGAEPVVTRLWIIGEADEESQRAYLNALPPPGTWRVLARRPFQDSVVLYVGRAPHVTRGPSPAD